MASWSSAVWAILVVCLVAGATEAGHVRKYREAASPKIIISGPVNVAVLAGQSVTLGCTQSVLGVERVQWVEYATNAAGAFISDLGSLLPGHPNYARYSLNYNNETGVHDLTISPVVAADGGLYLCRDANAASNAYAQLVVILALPNCTSTIPADGIVTEGTYQTLECQVQFSASYPIAPFLYWTGYGTFNQALAKTNTTVWSGAHFNVSRVQDGRAFQCVVNFTTDGFGGIDTASNAPTWNWVYQSNLLFVQYPPQNLSYAPVQSSYEVGTVVSCYSDAVPLPTYKWINMITLDEFDSQSFTITTDMVGVLVMRCLVTNSVGTGNLFANLTVNAVTTATTSTLAPSTTTIPPLAKCDDLSGRWEGQRDQYSKIVLCLNVDLTENGLVRGLLQNDTNEPYLTEVIGRTRSGEYDELGLAGIWPDRVGVSGFAGECRKCLGVETLLLNVLSRSSQDFAYCTDGGTIITSPTFTLYRVPVSYPCSTSVTAMKATLDAANKRYSRSARSIPRF